MKFMDFYFRNYKLMLIIPLILLLAGFLSIFIKYRAINDVFEKDVSLKGGISVTIYTEKAIGDLKPYLENKFNSDFLIRRLTEFGSDKQLGIVVEGSGIKDEDLKAALEEKLNIQLTDEDYSVEETGSALGESFYNQMLKALLFAFLFMAIVIFITFRNIMPSLIVIFSAVADLTITIGIIDIIGLRISTAGISALLLLIGYSLDTDILLTTKLLKRKEEGTIEERMLGAMKTGLTMTFTTMVALIIGYFIVGSFVLKEMFLIILIGLFVDIIVTYLFNGNILILYLKRKNG